MRGNLPIYVSVALAAFENGVGSVQILDCALSWLTSHQFTQADNNRAWEWRNDKKLETYISPHLARSTMDLMPVGQHRVLLAHLLDPMTILVNLKIISDLRRLLT